MYIDIYLRIHGHANAAPLADLDLQLQLPPARGRRALHVHVSLQSFMISASSPATWLVLIRFCSVIVTRRVGVRARACSPPSF